MSDVTDEEVDQARANVDALRAQLSQEVMDAEARSHSQDNTIIKAQLEAESQRLQNEIAAARQIAANPDQAAQQQVEQIMSSVPPPPPEDASPPAEPTTTTGEEG